MVHHGPLGYSVLQKSRREYSWWGVRLTGKMCYARGTYQLSPTYSRNPCNIANIPASAIECQQIGNFWEVPNAL